MRPGMAAIPRLIAATAVVSMAAFASPAAQQPGAAGLTLPFGTSGTTARGTADVSGSIRITHFVVQNTAVAAVATVVAHLNDATSASNMVTQVVLPVATIRATGQAGTTQQTFSTAGVTSPTSPTSNGASTSTSFPSSSPGVFSPSGATTIGPSGAATQVTTTPTQSASTACGPVHLEMGPLDINNAGLVVHLDRVVVDLAAPSTSALSTQATVGTAGSTQPSSAVLASSFGSGLCSVAGTVGQGQANLQNLADQLNQLLTTLG